MSEFSCPLKTEGMIEKIKIADASVAEEIRKGMQLATTEEKGLATPGMAYSTIKGSITLAANEEVKFDIKYSLILLSNSASGSSILFLHAHTYIKVAETGNMFSFLSNVQDKLSVISGGEYRFSVRNNSATELKLTYCFMRSQ